MPQTETVELLAGEISPFSTNCILDWFYGNRIGEDLTLRLLSVIVF